MTLRLSSHPTAGVKSGIGRGDNVAFGEWHDPEYEVSMSDFMEACFYALLNTDLLPDDPRLCLSSALKDWKPSRVTISFAIPTVSDLRHGQQPPPTSKSGDE